MNCANWEEQIAFYIGGDLRPAESAEVERHLGECPGCQVFASGIRESLNVLREAHTEDPNEAILAAVRARVMSELERQRRPFWRASWAYGLCAAALLLALVLVWPHHRIEVARHPAMPGRLAAASRAPSVEPSAAKPGPVRLVRTHRRKRTKPLLPPAPPLDAPEKTLVVKLLTEDPNVVIYWITDTRGE